MTSDYTSHDGTVKSNPARPGYVSYLCSAWGLPDNTVGKTGWYNVYLLQDERMTSAMKSAGREHNAAAREAAALEEKLQAAAGTTGRHSSYGLCPKCGTYCCGDCEAWDR